MIPTKRLFVPFVCLTFVVLAACEPLAPEQTAQYVVVTGETPDSLSAPSPTFLLGETPAAETSAVPASNAGGVVNTPVPSPTPLPTATALPTSTPFACSETEGRTIESSFYSVVAGGEVPFRMYQPPCFYETFKRYPYVILLHGTGYTESMWDDLGAGVTMDQSVTKGTLSPMVLIMPDGGMLSEINDLPDGASYETVILDELIPHIEATYCLWGSRQGRAIGGISRGGFWAFSIALRHPEMFSAVGGHSPHFEADNASPESNPLDLAGRVSLDKFPLRIYMDNAANDYVGANAIQMSTNLRDNGIAHDYLINPNGDHDADYWRAHISEYLSFYGQVWPRDAAALPSCEEPSPE